MRIKKAQVQVIFGGEGGGLLFFKTSENIIKEKWRLSVESDLFTSSLSSFLFCLHVNVFHFLIHEWMSNPNNKVLSKPVMNQLNLCCDPSHLSKNTLTDDDNILTGFAVIKKKIS